MNTLGKIVSLVIASLVITLLCFSAKESWDSNTRLKNWCKVQGYLTVIWGGTVLCVDPDRRLVLPE